MAGELARSSLGLCAAEAETCRLAHAAQAALRLVARRGARGLTEARGAGGRLDGARYVSRGLLPDPREAPRGARFGLCRGTRNGAARRCEPASGSRLCAALDQATRG